MSEKRRRVSLLSGPRKKKEKQKDRARGVRELVLTSQEMALQMLRVQICLGAVRARELAVGILDRDNRVFRGAAAGLGSGRAAGRAG